MDKPLTGRKVFAITASAFAVIIGVNLVLAVQAVRTFPGLEVKSSYVASQTFDANRRAQEALGWRLAHRYDGDVLRLEITDRTGLPADIAAITAVVGRPTEARDDVVPDLVPAGGGYETPLVLAPGRWLVMLEATARDGTIYRKRIDFRVAGAAG